MSHIKPRPLPPFGRPEHFKATHQLGYDRGAWINVMRLGKRWVTADGQKFDSTPGEMVRKIRKAQPAAPQPRHSVSTPRTAPLRRTSEQRRDWEAVYKLWLAFLRAWNLVPARCARCNRPKKLDPHHVFGRIGALILVFIFVCRDCHEWIHDNTKQARADGWLRDLE